jgi:hypothetical protein
MPLGFYAGEAQELHEFLDSKGVPWKHYSPDGGLKDENGTYHYLPLIDRVNDYAKAVSGQGPKEGPGPGNGSGMIILLM